MGADKLLYAGPAESALWITCPFLTEAFLYLSVYYLHSDWILENFHLSVTQTVGQPGQCGQLILPPLICTRRVQRDLNGLSPNRKMQFLVGREGQQSVRNVNQIDYKFAKTEHCLPISVARVNKTNTHTANIRLTFTR